jgi:capsular polysaccharide biosynthesis protein
MQVRYYNDHGILLGVHGAGFINCMFMRQGAWWQWWMTEGSL